MGVSGIHSHSHLSHRPQQSPDHNHLSSDHPHLQSLISTHQLPFKYTLPTDTHSVWSTVHNLNRHQTKLYLPVLCTFQILLCFPVVVPGLILIPTLCCSYKERTLISQQLRHIWTVSLSGFLTCQSLHTIAIPSSINHCVVSLTCCFRLCLWQGETICQQIFVFGWIILLMNHSIKPDLFFCFFSQFLETFRTIWPKP